MEELVWSCEYLVVLFDVFKNYIRNCVFWLNLNNYFQEKAPYVAKAEKRKVEYEKNMKAYNKRQVIQFSINEHNVFVWVANNWLIFQAEGPKDEDVESDKSVSEVNDEDDDEEGSGDVSCNISDNCCCWNWLLLVDLMNCFFF